MYLLYPKFFLTYLENVFTIFQSSDLDEFPQTSISYVIKWYY